MYLLKLLRHKKRLPPKGDLHSTMYLLKLAVQGYISLQYQFTFHYVSIKTDDLIINSKNLILFTFHYVSIKTPTSPITIVFFLNLHSTMYLLKQYPYAYCQHSQDNLHSTMYLLKHNSRSSFRS